MDKRIVAVALGATLTIGGGTTYALSPTEESKIQSVLDRQEVSYVLHGKYERITDCSVGKLECSVDEFNGPDGPGYRWHLYRNLKDGEYHRTLEVFKSGKSNDSGWVLTRSKTATST